MLPMDVRLSMNQSKHPVICAIRFLWSTIWVSGGFRGGGAPDAHPPTAQNFLDFMQFFGKFDKIVCWRPLPREGRRSLLQGILDLPLWFHCTNTDHDCHALQMRVLILVGTAVDIQHPVISVRVLHLFCNN